MSDETFSFDDYLEAVTLGILPELPVIPYMGGGLAGSQTFRLVTIGMDKFDRPELEMVEVPAAFINAAGKTINYWAHYSIVEKPVKADEKIIVDGPLPILIRVTETDDPNTLRLVTEAVQFECSECGSNDGKGPPSVH